MIVGPRNQALLAASVLALSTASPASVLASDLDQEKEGTAAPEQVAEDQAHPPPAFDPGGQTTALPVDVASSPVAGAVLDPADETAPLEQEPTTDEIATVEGAAEGAGTPSVEQQEEPPATEPAPAPPAAEPPATEPAPAPKAPEAPAATQQEPQGEGSPPPQADERPPRPAEPKDAEPPARAVAAEPATPPQPEPIPVPAAVSSSTVVLVSKSRATHRDAAQPADRFHVVQRGESLWSIAKDVLGDDASVARIAREVNRLWELNSERIGTGEPDLVIAGTRIALR